MLGETRQKIVTIGGGYAELGGGNAWRVWYFIDRQARLCAQEIGNIGGHVPCCNIWRVKAAQPYLKWLNAETCKANNDASQTSGDQD